MRVVFRSEHAIHFLARQTRRFPIEMQSHYSLLVDIQPHVVLLLEADFASLWMRLQWNILLHRDFSDQTADGATHQGKVRLNNIAAKQRNADTFICDRERNNKVCERISGKQFIPLQLGIVDSIAKAAYLL